MAIKIETVDDRSGNICISKRFQWICIYSEAIENIILKKISQTISNTGQ
jgi:hypothetical protein